jgi:hypothetical protein
MYKHLPDIGHHGLDVYAVRGGQIAEQARQGEIRMRSPPP